MADPDIPPHLVVSRTGRGLAWLPVILDKAGGDIHVSESSATDGPHVHVAVSAAGDAYAHLTAEEAWKLADQLRYLVINHHLGDARPDWAREGEVRDV